MGCCFTVKKNRTSNNIINRNNDRKSSGKKNRLFTISNWNNVLDFLSYKELNTTARICR